MRNFLFLLFMSLIINMSCSKDNKLPENIIQKEISSNWQFKQTGDGTWLPATVPGTIHTDYLAAGSIQDPYYRTNERHLQYLDKEDYEYKHTLNVSDELFAKKEIRLTFEGLDTYATIFLNSNEMLKTDNMFRNWEVSCKAFLHTGENELLVLLESPIKVGLEKLETNGYPLPASNDQSENGELGDKKVSIFTRKAGYHFGWDWGPRLVTSGIWRPVKLLGYDYGKIENVQIIQNKITPEKASLSAIVSVDAVSDDEFEVLLLVNGEMNTSKKQSLKAGHHSINIDFEIEHPKFWWPNGMGEQYLYDVEVSLEKRGVAIVDQKQMNIGIRTVKLVQEPDEEGKSFYFEINGRPVFAKGANYIPNDVFLPRFQPEDYERIVKDAAEANMNMLRVWGGGIYENDIFYDLCDKYGLMVWQDFMYACSMYPGDDDFLNNARLEAEENIIRLRNHPSLVLWCGNNEIEVAWAEWEEGKGWGWKERYTGEQRKQIWHAYDTLFHHILPEAVKKYNPQTAYWHSSPSAGMYELAGYESTSGDMHYWGVWHGQHPFSDFRKYRARFMSEYGFQSFPELNTVKTYTLTTDWDIESEVMAAHQRSGIGNLRIRQYMEADYNIPDDFEEFLYVSQLLQAEAIKMAIESHRTDRPYCMGSLYWQLNDCWPVASWSGIDYDGRWKALHYFVKKAFSETILASFQDESAIQIWAITDQQRQKDARLETRICNVEGQSVWAENEDFVLDMNASKMVKHIPLAQVKSLGNLNALYLHSQLFLDDELVTEDIHYFVKVKDLTLDSEQPEITVESKNGYMEISLTAKTLTKNVFLSTGSSTAHFSDNFFDLLPGETKRVTFPEVFDADEFLNELKVMFL